MLLLATLGPGGLKKHDEPSYATGGSHDIYEFHVYIYIYIYVHGLYKSKKTL